MRRAAIRGQSGLTFLAVAAVALAATACGDRGTGLAQFDELTCSLNDRFLVSGGVRKDGIPALTNPAMVGPASPEAGYLADDDRVIGLVVDGEAMAIPHNVLWWHEIVNLDLDSGLHLAVTYCPLTGSSMAFDRAKADNVEFGVSGLLFNMNLVMYDRRPDDSQESLWPQMGTRAQCGVADGTRLDMVPVQEMTWAGWVELHPETSVISEDTGRRFDYTIYPYANYESLNNTDQFGPLDGGFDTRRPPKERVLGIRDGDDFGIAFPFLALDENSANRAVNTVAGGSDVVVLWDTGKRSAMAFGRAVGDQVLTFTATETGFVDDQTGSAWTVAGEAVDGPMAGTRLEPVAEAYVAFWFAWAVFQPQTEIWGSEDTGV